MYCIYTHCNIFLVYMNILFILPFGFRVPFHWATPWSWPEVLQQSMTSVPARWRSEAATERDSFGFSGRGRVQWTPWWDPKASSRDTNFHGNAWHGVMVKWMAFNIFARLLKDEWCLRLGMVCLNAACLLSKNLWRMFSMKLSTAASCFLAKKQMHNLCLPVAINHILHCLTYWQVPHIVFLSKVDKKPYGAMLHPTRVRVACGQLVLEAKYVVLLDLSETSPSELETSPWTPSSAARLWRMAFRWQPATQWLPTSVVLPRKDKQSSIWAWSWLTTNNCKASTSMLMERKSFPRCRFQTLNTVSTLPWTSHRIAPYLQRIIDHQHWSRNLALKCVPESRVFPHYDTFAPTRLKLWWFFQKLSESLCHLKLRRFLLAYWKYGKIKSLETWKSVSRNRPAFYGLPILMVFLQLSLALWMNHVLVDEPASPVNYDTDTCPDGQSIFGRQVEGKFNW